MEHIAKTASKDDQSNVHPHPLRQGPRRGRRTPDALTDETADSIVSTLDRAELLLVGSNAFSAAQRRDGRPGAEVENRNALLVAQACLARLLAGVSAV